MFLSTAHPCKFPEVIPDEIARQIIVPEQVKKLETRSKFAVAIGKEFAGLKEQLLKIA